MYLCVYLVCMYVCMYVFMYVLCVCCAYHRTKNCDNNSQWSSSGREQQQRRFCLLALLLIVSSPFWGKLTGFAPKIGLQTASVPKGRINAASIALGYARCVRVLPLCVRQHEEHFDRIIVCTNRPSIWGQSDTIYRGKSRTFEAFYDRGSPLIF